MTDRKPEVWLRGLMDFSHRRQRMLEIERTRGTRGIAVMNDAAAVEWRSCEFSQEEHCAVLDALPEIFELLGKPDAATERLVEAVRKAKEARFNKDEGDLFDCLDAVFRELAAFDAERKGSQ